MTKLQSSGQVTSTSFQNSTQQHDKNDLKQAIKDFLFAASGTPVMRELCPHCGEPFEYRDTVFWLDGEDGSFNIRLPVCRCSAKSLN
jgi:hypothetical protein